MSPTAPTAQRALSWRATPLVIELAALAVVVIGFSAAVVGLIAIDGPLHWDEAVYAVRARSWLDAHAVLSGWSHIRPPLLPMLAAVPAAVGGEEWQLRSIGFAAGLGVVLVSWWIGRMIGGRLAGALAAAAVATSPTLLKESATLLTDVPASALMLAAVALLWWGLEEREGPGVALPLAAAACGLAFFMRYGSVLAVAPLGAVVVTLWWPRLLRARAATAAAAGVAFIAVAGHLAWSMLATGRPLGILLDAQNVVAVDPGGEPWRDYRRFLPFVLAGWAGSVAIRLGVESLAAASLAAAIRPAWRRELRAALLLLLPAFAQVFLVTRGVGHVEPRFFVYSTACLVIAGAVFVAVVLRHAQPLLRWGAVAALAVALLVSFAGSVDDARERTVAIATYYHRFEVAARAIAAVAGPECGIVGGGDPILAWYSGCETNRLRLSSDGEVALNLTASERWAVIFGDPDAIDAAAPVPAAVAEEADGPPLRIVDPTTGDEIAAAWRLRPSGP